MNNIGIILLITLLILQVRTAGVSVATNSGMTSGGFRYLFLYSSIRNRLDPFRFFHRDRGSV